MNFLKTHYILLILLGTTCFIQFIIFFRNNQLKELEKLNNQSDNIEKCIDIENKNKRSMLENIKLSEYCINNFGTTERF